MAADGYTRIPAKMFLQPQGPFVAAQTGKASAVAQLENLCQCTVKPEWRGSN